MAVYVNNDSSVVQASANGSIAFYTGGVKALNSTLYSDNYTKFESDSYVGAIYVGSATSGQTNISTSTFTNPICDTLVYRTNNNTAFNTSTYRYTAPTSGIYLFYASAQVLKANTIPENTPCYHMFRRNGSSQSGRATAASLYEITGISQAKNTFNQLNFGAASMVWYQLAAGDYIDFVLYHNANSTAYSYSWWSRTFAGVKIH